MTIEFLRNAIKKLKEIDFADTVFIRVYCALFFREINLQICDGYYTRNALFGHILMSMP